MNTKNIIIAIAGLSIGAVAAAFADVAAAGCPQWISVMPLNGDRCEELASDCADLGNTTFIDGIAWCCAVNPHGDPVCDSASMYAERYRAVSPRLKQLSGVPQGILLQATMGHGGFPGSATPWQLAVKRDGTSVYRMCPMDERFLAYIAKTCRTFAELKPDFFMIDDDTRLIWDGVPGCFCPLHLAEFSGRTGREWTREEVVAMLDKGASRERDVWVEVKLDSLRRFFRTIRDNFGDEIPGILCCCWQSPHKEHASEFARILATPGQTPVIRGSGAPYHAGGKDLCLAGGKDLFHVVSARCSYAAELELVGRDVVLMQECDTCPQTLWATSALRTYDYLVMLALEGCKGAKIWITRIANYHEKKSGEAYKRIFRKNRGIMEWAAKVDFRQRGVVVPTCGPPWRNFADRYLALTGIPYRFGKAQPGEVTALTTETLELLPREEIRGILSGTAIVDGPAAVWLSENGFSGDIGVTAKAWKRKTIQIHEFDNGMWQFGMRTANLADLVETMDGAEVLTRLLNRQQMDAEPVCEAPGSILFVNARGGRVLTFAQRLPVQEPRYFEAEFFSEGYRAQMVRWLKKLGGGLPGGVCYLGVGPVTCESGRTADGKDIVVLNALDLDGDAAPELVFAEPPALIERLQGNGEWAQVKFDRSADGVCRLDSPILTQRPAIFRLCRAADDHLHVQQDGARREVGVADALE